MNVMRLVNIILILMLTEFKNHDILNVPDLFAVTSFDERFNNFICIFVIVIVFTNDRITINARNTTTNRSNGKFNR